MRIIVCIVALCLATLSLSCSDAPTAVEEDGVAAIELQAKTDKVAVSDFGGWPFWFNTLNPLPFVNFMKGEPDWVPVIFYHDMTCTPTDLDLMSSGLDFGSLACPTLVDGFMLWPDGAMIPKMQMLEGSGPLEIWFVSMDDWWTAADDGQVLMSEYMALPSFRAAVSTYYHHKTSSNASNLVAEGIVTSEPETEFALHLVAQFRYDDAGVMISEDIPLFEISFF
jgi:hypothetical protein